MTPKSYNFDQEWKIKAVLDKMYKNKILGNNELSLSLINFDWKDYQKHAWVRRKVNSMKNYSTRSNIEKINKETCKKIQKMYRL